ncbi:HAD-IIB family hydrolase [Aurantiacibacter spongiae]|uniref:sucrose-phosphate synthase n=1 Tax=Aurantiacibacter spongiae TaxID=2488860 RepID=A0A3N5D8Q9_9SPHN|nr:HAD-IIB family hydrolase [Aurantiacibacter spongiae]RPF71028.1 HAD-IIB family hydrolase [Aurantiacibacter spongiae]
MFICHVALQGCLTLRNVPYGLTADTGGHIKYLLELAQANAEDEAIMRVDLVTRGFVDEMTGDRFAPGCSERDGKINLVRLDDGDPTYLPKEELASRHAALCDAFLAYLADLPRLPDVIHCHYADAGILGAAAKERYDIPMIFTAHSLGAVKKAANGGGDAILDERIAIEERVLESADAIIASSRDEAEAQYAHYANAEVGRIRVIPPGCELSSYQAAKPTAKVRKDVGRFLTDPDKPILLAIARPVRKKNLLALVDAYAGDKALQNAANLVLVAGCRGLLTDLEVECREVLEELILAVEKHDLYGRVAYPKRHEPDDIPAYYALARESGGVFVNPALNEPFGLTLLEAAAARLPVVATDSGGPNDIIERCRNGLLVPPTDSNAIAHACKSIIKDRRQWLRFSNAGAGAVAAYDWAGHAEIYHRLIGDLTAIPTATPRWKRLLVCDIDNTLLGDREALRDFLDWQSEQAGKMALGIATGRSFNSAQAILAAEGVPTPDVIVSGVGTQIHWYDRATRRYIEDADWAQRMAKDWNPARIAQIAQTIGLRPQSLLEQKTGKTSFFLDDHDEADVRRAFRDADLPVEVIASHSRYLDVLPGGVGKDAAVMHVAERLGLLLSRVVVAGDSGNDRAMLRSCPHPIVVGNWSDGLADDPALSHAYIASASHAAGVLEGVKHFRAQGSW